MRSQTLLFKLNICILGLILLVLFINIKLPAQEEEVPPPVQTPLPQDLPLPESVTLCGEKIPIETRQVMEMFDRELTISALNRAQVSMWLKRAGRYFPGIERTLAKADLPDDLKYLAVAESNLINYVRSPKGAVGTWQFMASTAQRYGLRKSRMLDERRDVGRATEAAVLYLKELKEMFGTWFLALAAYNCGEDLIEREIEEQQVNDYFRLNLPIETERFVFRISAIKTILENPGRYGYNLSPERIYDPIGYDTVKVNIGSPLHVTQVAHAVDTDFKTMKELNTHILGHYLPTGKYILNVPSGRGAEIADILKRLTLKAQLKKRKRSPRYTVVKRGDTLNLISRRTGVPVTTLRKLNGIEGSLILAGQRLRLTP
jgi:LysM repeat protein